MKKKIVLIVFSILILISYGCKKQEVSEEVIKDWNNTENTIINEFNDVLMYDNLFVDVPTWENKYENGVYIYKSEKAILGISFENGFALDQIKNSLGASVYYSDKTTKDINGFKATIKEYTVSYDSNSEKPALDYSLSKDDYNINFVIIGLKNATKDEVYNVSEEFINRIKINVGE